MKFSDQKKEKKKSTLQLRRLLQSFPSECVCVLACAYRGLIMCGTLEANTHEIYTNRATNIGGKKVNEQAADAESAGLRRGMQFVQIFCVCRNAACETPKLQCFLYKSGLIDQSSQQLFAGDHSNWKQSQRIETRAVTINTTKSDKNSLPRNQNGIENSSGTI